MQINERHIFTFIFPFIANEVATFNVVADSQADAVAKLQDWMQKTMLELSVQFPRVKSEKIPTASVVSPFIPQEVIEVKIEALISDLAKYGFKQGKSTKETVEKLTKVEYIPENYPDILTQLEKIKKEAEDVKN